LALNFAGTYTLLVEGRRYAAGTSSYTFNIDPRGNVPVAPLPAGTAFTLGATVAGTSATTTQLNNYNFTLTADTRVYLDGLTTNSSFRWTLRGPRGTVVSNRSFASTDSYDGQFVNGGVTVYDLVAGDYVVTVDGSTGGFAFRVLDVAQATSVASGALTSGSLNPANETDLYRISVTAGERWFFDMRSASGGDPYWKLLDPYGRVVFGPNYMPNGDIELGALGYTGDYTLMIEGRYYVGGSTSYSFVAQKVADDQSTLTLGSTVNGAIDHVGQVDYYTFTLAG